MQGNESSKKTVLVAYAMVTDGGEMLHIVEGYSSPKFRVRLSCLVTVSFLAVFL